MWISKLVLNPRSKAARRDLANPYDMHRTLVWAVAEEAAAGRERLLWRTEPYRSFESPVVLVQTLTRPVWSEVLARHPDYAYLDPSSPKPFDPQLLPGQVLRFRLKANPSVKRRGKRFGLVGQKETMDWLRRKMGTAGCELLEGVVVTEDRVVASKGTGQLTVLAVLFEGLIRVNDPAACRIAIERGVGPGKGLGLGLLSVARPR